MQSMCLINCIYFLVSYLTLVNGGVRREFGIPSTDSVVSSDKFTQLGGGRELQPNSRQVSRNFFPSQHLPRPNVIIDNARPPLRNPSSVKFDEPRVAENTKQTRRPPAPGPCPNVPIVKDFQIEKYMGRWYEIERFYSPVLEGSQCGIADYQLFPNCSLAITMSNIINGGLQRQLAVGHTAGDPYLGSFIVDFPTTATGSSSVDDVDGLQGNNIYNVVGTDYRNYAIVHSCTKVKIGEEMVKSELSWILGRFPTLEPQFVAKLKHWLGHVGIDADSYLRTNQFNCDGRLG